MKHLWEEKGHNSSGYLVRNTRTGEVREFATQREAREFLLEESAELAKECGVDESKILHNMNEVNNFFTGGK